MGDALTNSHPEIVGRLLNEFASHEKNGEQIDSAKLKTRLKSELGVNVGLEEIVNDPNLTSLAAIVNERLERNKNGKTCIEIFGEIESIAKVELEGSVQLRRYARWVEFQSLGNWLTKPDWIDFMELFMQIDDRFGVKFEVTANTIGRIPETVGATVKEVMRQMKKSINSQA